MGTDCFNWAFPHLRPYWGDQGKPKKVESRPGIKLVCELPAGSSVKVLDAGRLIALHPMHAPIIIGRGEQGE